MPIKREAAYLYSTTFLRNHATDQLTKAAYLLKGNFHAIMALAMMQSTNIVLLPGMVTVTTAAAHLLALLPGIYLGFTATIDIECGAFYQCCPVGRRSMTVTTAAAAAAAHLLALSPGVYLGLDHTVSQIHLLLFLIRLCGVPGLLLSKLGLHALVHLPQSLLPQLLPQLRLPCSKTLDHVASAGLYVDTQTSIGALHCFSLNSYLILGSPAVSQSDRSVESLVPEDKWAQDSNGADCNRVAEQQCNGCTDAGLFTDADKFGCTGPVPSAASLTAELCMHTFFSVRAVKSGMVKLLCNCGAPYNMLRR